MGFFQDLINQLPLYLLSLPVILLSLSVHESAHGYVAYKLGDPTARNLGRITLNPVKHFDLFGFLCMVFARFGWAKPVPIVTRNFKNPRRDMALTGAAGPLSNLALALISLVVLRISMFLLVPNLAAEANEFAAAYLAGEGYKGSVGFTILALLVYIFVECIGLNVVLAIFNLIPIPPFDGSRIFYVFLPPNWYFGIMKYEQYIMIGFFVLLFLGVMDTPLGLAENFVINLLYTVTGMGESTDALTLTAILRLYVRQLVGVA